jgi:hypothetical protein
MTTITATAAATQAGVTVATIRTWARRGVIAAVKTAGRWVIDTTSLAHRIAIGARHARKQAAMTQPTGALIRIRRNLYGVLGNAEQLAAAYEAGTPVTLTDDYAGDKLPLGYTRQTYGDYGRTMETLGLYRIEGDGQAIYYIDMSTVAHMDEAPLLKADLLKTWEAQEAAAAAADAADDEYFNPRYM